MGLKAPLACCGVWLCIICLLIIHFVFKYFKTSKSNIFQFSKTLNNNPSPQFSFIKNIRWKIIQIFSKNLWAKDSNLMESFLIEWNLG